MKDESDDGRFLNWSHILFDQATLAEGGQLDDPAAFVKRSIRSGDGDVPRGRVRLRAPADEIGTRVPARYATVAPDGPDACVVTTTGRWSREFLVWMALMDAEMTVLEPPELAEEAGRIAARLREVAAG